jgi:hypothetical protein
MVLKIQRSDDGYVVRLLLSGRIELQHVAELRRLIDEAERGAHPVTLDLKDVRLVDREAMAFLGRCESSGVSLENCPVYVRESLSRQRR